MKRYLFLIALAACAKQSSGSIGQAEAQYAGQTLAAGVEDNASAYGAVNAGVGLDANCVTLSGDINDPDGDSIPNDATLSFNCTSTGFGLTGMLTGSETLKDTEASQVAWAFSATAMFHASLTAQAGASITQDRSGSFVATQTGTTGPFSLERMLDATTVFKGDRGNTLATVDETNGWTMTYTPQIQWQPGTIVVGGTLDVSGSWTVTVNGKTADATLRTPDPLVLSPSCQTRVTGGGLMAEFVGATAHSAITVTWTGCGSSTVTYLASAGT